MNSTDTLAKKNNYKGIAISIAVHVVIILLFLWVTVWQEPYPPNPEFGIELNMGSVNTGAGNEPAGSEAVIPQEAEENEEVAEEVAAVEALDQVESNESEAVDEAITQNDGLVEQKDEPATKVQSEAVKETKTAQKQAETKQVEAKDPPKPNPNALFPGKNASQGESSKEQGDQGVKDGNVDAKALMGTQGGGNGSKLDMVGWAWNSPPRPKDNSDQNGKVVIEIKVNSDGEVIGTQITQTTVSLEIAKIYENEVQRLSFYKTSGGSTLSSYTGKITFIIRSK